MPSTMFTSQSEPARLRPSHHTRSLRCTLPAHGGEAGESYSYLGTRTHEPSVRTVIAVTLFPRALHRKDFTFKCHRQHTKDIYCVRPRPRHFEMPLLVRTSWQTTVPCPYAQVNSVCFNTK